MPKPPLTPFSRQPDITLRASSSRRDFLLYAAALGCCSAVCGCRSVPLTKRPQLLLIPEKQEINLGLSAYQKMAVQAPGSQDERLSEMIRRVGLRIAGVADRPDYQWEFRLVADQTQNAFCMPGGKVAMYEGMLPICEDEAGVATVMSHEVAHALARHGGERMSQSLAIDKAKILAEKLSGTYAPGKQQLLMAAYGAGSKYGVILPFSRKHELEADRIGIMLMAQAGYDPHAAPRLWEKFASVKQGRGPAEFFSTHPSDRHRVQQLNEVLAEATELYQKAPHQFGFGESV